MRLSPKKIESLSKAICRSLEANPDLEFAESADKVQVLIRRVIAEDMRLEEEIEEEARKLLEQHKGEIDRKGASYDALLRKAKAKIAQERKVVL
jgi:hypothetical protein